MDLFIEIIDGPLKGTRAPLRDGLTLGRRDCDINIEDPKVSSKHARMEAKPDGSFWLVDLQSSNGIRVEGQRLEELELTAGTAFRLGRTRLQILSAGESAFEGLQTQVKDVFKKAKSKDPKKAKTAGRTWRDEIIHLSERVIRESDPGKKREAGLVPFPNALRLSFKKGMQSGTEWILGYGPREIGASSVDLPLYEPGFPAKCFRIVAQESDLVIRLHEDLNGKILLNGKRFETAFIRPGDVIELGNTQIIVSFET